MGQRRGLAVKIFTGLSIPTCAMMLGMRFLPRFGSKRFGSEGSVGAAVDSAVGAAVGAGVPGDAPAEDVSGEVVEPDESHFFKTIGWVSAALGAVALGLIVGRELRQRYKFNRRTPYDLYSHSGDEMPDVDFGVGV
jgi:hypothetical protein